MPHYRRWIVLLIMLSATLCFSAGLEIQVEQKKMKLPFWPATSKDRMGAVLLVNGSSQYVSPIMEKTAKDLSALGWSVVLLDTKTSSSVNLNQQISNALKSLRKKDNKRLVLIHYGDQVQASMNYFTKPRAKKVDGLVLLSAYDLNPPQAFPALKLPMLDVSGQFDYEPVLSEVKLREKKYRDESYLALTIPGAKHDYRYQRTLLSYYLHGWMSKLPTVDTSKHPFDMSRRNPIRAKPWKKPPSSRAAQRIS